MKYWFVEFVDSCWSGKAFLSDKLKKNFRQVTGSPCKLIQHLSE